MTDSTGSSESIPSSASSPGTADPSPSSSPSASPSTSPSPSLSVSASASGSASASASTSASASASAAASASVSLSSSLDDVSVSVARVEEPENLSEKAKEVGEKSEEEEEEDDDDEEEEEDRHREGCACCCCPSTRCCFVPCAFLKKKRALCCSCCKFTFTLKTVFQVLVLLLLLVGIIIAVFNFIKTDEFTAFLSWVRSIEAWGWGMFVLIFAFLSFPWTWGWTPCAIVSGYLFGPFLGPGIIIIGDSIGYVLAFYILGKFCRSWTQKKLTKKPKLKTVVEAVEKRPILFVTLLRFTPLSQGLQNALLSMSAIKLLYYLIPSILTSFPNAIMWSLVGHFTAKSLTAIIRGEASVGFVEIISIVLQVCAVVLITLLMGFFGKRALNKFSREKKEAAALNLSTDSTSSDSTASPSHLAPSEVAVFDRSYEDSSF